MGQDFLDRQYDGCAVQANLADNICAVKNTACPI